MQLLIHVCCAPCLTYPHKFLKDEGHEVVGYFFNPNIHPYQEFQKRMQCLERYSALRPVEIIYDTEYNLDKFLVRALEAMYDPPEEYRAFQNREVESGSNSGSGAGAFSEKIAVKEKLEIRLTPKDNHNSKATSVEVSSTEDINTEQSINKNNNDFNTRCGYCISLRLERTATAAAQKGFDGFTTTLLESKYQPHEYIRSVGEKLSAKHDIEFFYKDFRTGWKESVKISKELKLYRQQYCGCIFSELERFGPKQDIR